MTTIALSPSCTQVGVVAEALTLTGSIHDYPVVPECDLNVHLSKLLETGNLSDVTLAVGDKEFKAHKAILAGELHSSKWF